jgi:hypothetical protein
MWTTGRKDNKKSPMTKTQGLGNGGGGNSGGGSGGKGGTQMRVPLSFKQGLKLDPEFFVAI